jgi:RNA polymerase sigma factor, sigma-70 family
MALSDHEDLATLLNAASAGDQRAFAALYRQTSAHLFGLMLRMLKRRDWAEEALQDCFVKIWQRAGTYAPERGAPLAWLSTIARNRALDLLRARRPEDELPDDDTLAAVDGRADPLADASTLQGVEALRDCFGELPPSSATACCSPITRAIPIRNWRGVLPHRWAPSRAGSGAACCA